MVLRNGVTLHCNLYLNVFLAAFIEIPAYLLNIVLLQCLERRLSMSGSTFLVGLDLLITLGVSKGISIYSCLVSFFHKQSKHVQQTIDIGYKKLCTGVNITHHHLCCFRFKRIVSSLDRKFFITMAFLTAYQYANELYPTYIRTLGLLCSS